VLQKTTKKKIQGEFLPHDTCRLATALSRRGKEDSTWYETRNKQVTMKLVRKSTTHNPHVNQQTKIRNTQKQRHDANTNPPYN